MRIRFYALAALVLAAALFFACEQTPGPGAGTGTDPAPPAATGIVITSPPDIIVYGRNQEFNPAGLEVAYTYSDDTTKAIGEGGYTLDPVDTSVAGPKRVKVYAGGYETSFNIVVQVSDAVLQSITVSGPATKTYNLGEAFNRIGLMVTGHFSDGDKDMTPYAVVAGYNPGKRGAQDVTVTVNQFSAAIEGITTIIGADANVVPNTPNRKGMSNENHQLFDYQNVYIKGETPTPQALNLQVTVSPGDILLTFENGGLTKADFDAVLASWDPNKQGIQTLAFDLDGKKFNIDCYVMEVESAVWFDYGYMRHEGDPTGHGPGAGKFYAKPGETLVIAPVRYLLGYNSDHTDAGVSYEWTVGGGATYTTSGGGEFLHITPAEAGTYSISIAVTGRDYASGETVTRTAETELVCYASPLDKGTFASPLRNMGTGQFAEGGTGLGWSLGAAGGYEVWAVEHRDNYYIRGNAFGAWFEAGVVWVQEDKNGNGLPDEMWYELKGSDDDRSAYKNLITRRYAVTYELGDGEPVTNEYNQVIRRVYWVDAKGRRSIIPGGFPNIWGVEGDRVTYTTTLLRDDGNINTASYNGLLNMEGYVDTFSDRFYVNAAMDASGSPVTQTDVRFIKVQTAVFRYGGLFGDVSTEVYNADFLGPQTDFPLPEDS